MKYICLFEQFERGHKFDILDLYLIDLGEVKELFFKELEKRNTDMENIQVFLDSGLVDVNTKDDAGWTPLHWAAYNNSLELAQLLISSGAELDAEDIYYRTPLRVAAGRRYSLELAQFLISSGAEVNAKDNDGNTPLHMAAYNNYLELAQLLISSGAEVNADNNSGWTPLHSAASQEMRELLKSHGGVQ